MGFMDHMLTLLCFHARMDLDLTCRGDLEVDAHHSAEDIGIALGQALAQAAGDKRGIARYGQWLLPMDEALVLTALDLSGRACPGLRPGHPRPEGGRLRHRAGEGVLPGLHPLGRHYPAPSPAGGGKQPSHHRSRLQGGGPGAAPPWPDPAFGRRLLKGTL